MSTIFNNLSGSLRLASQAMVNFEPKIRTKNNYVFFNKATSKLLYNILIENEKRLCHEPSLQETFNKD